MRTIGYTIVTLLAILALADLATAAKSKCKDKSKKCPEPHETCSKKVEKKCQISCGKCVDAWMTEWMEWSDCICDPDNHHQLRYRYCNEAIGKGLTCKKQKYAEIEEDFRDCACPTTPAPNPEGFPPFSLCMKCDSYPCDEDMPEGSTPMPMQYGPNKVCMGCMMQQCPPEDPMEEEEDRKKKPDEEDEDEDEGEMMGPMIHHNCVKCHVHMDYMTTDYDYYYHGVTLGLPFWERFNRMPPTEEGSGEMTHEMDPIDHVLMNELYLSCKMIPDCYPPGMSGEEE